MLPILALFSLCAWAADEEPIDLTIRGTNVEGFQTTLCASNADEEPLDLRMHLGTSSTSPVDGLQVSSTAAEERTAPRSPSQVDGPQVSSSTSGGSGIQDVTEEELTEAIITRLRKQNTYAAVQKADLLTACLQNMITREWFEERQKTRGLTSYYGCTWQKFRRRVRDLKSRFKKDHGISLQCGPSFKKV